MLCDVIWPKGCDEWYVMYEIDHVLVIGFMTYMSMSMTTGRSHRSCLYFFVWPACHWITPCKLLYFIAKHVSHRSRSNRWRDDFMKTQWWRSWWWRSWCHAGDDGDHDGTLEMEIKGTRWWWPYHVTYFDCMWCLSCFASYLLRMTVVSKMIPYDNFQKSVPPNCAPLRRFVVSKHHVMIGCDRF